MKKNIKDRLLKALHVVSYILSVLFILVCIVFGVGSCNLKNKTSSNNINNIENDLKSEVVKPIHRNLSIEDSNYEYIGTLKSSFTSSWDAAEEVSYQDGAYINVNTVTFTTGAKVRLIPNSTYTTYIYFENSLVVYNDIYDEDVYQAFVIRFKWNGSTEKLDVTKIYLSSVAKNFDLWESGVYKNPGCSFMFSGFDNFIMEAGINEFYPGQFDYQKFFRLFLDIDNVNDLNVVDYFFDTYQINPIQYLSYEIMDDNTAHNIGTWTANIDLDMFFISNGVSYKKIRFQYDYVLGTWYNENLTTYENMTYLALSYIAYQNYSSDEWVKVCYPRIYKYETRTLNNVSQIYGYPFTDFNTYLWANDGYKDIKILNGGNNIFTNNSVFPIANQTNIQVLTYEGNYNSGVSLGGNNTTNVFVLLGQGFSSVAGLFGIVLLPGITIGTLLFLPLVVLIIFAIIRIIHK